MEIEILKKANILDKKIRELKDALSCFEWRQSFDDDELKGNYMSTNPVIIIEFDGTDDREQIKIPMQLNESFVKILKNEIKKELISSISLFDLL